MPLPTSGQKPNPPPSDKFEATDTARAGPSVGEAAPQVSPGAWKERAFVPRGTMPRPVVLAELEKALTLLPGSVPVEAQRTELKAAWLPMLQQVVEQVGGDGLDAYVASLLGKAVALPKERAVGLLEQGIRRVDQAESPEAVRAAAAELISEIRELLADATARKVSLKRLERELDGQLGVDSLLRILFSTDEELSQRQSKLDETLESLRGQITAMPGQKPDGMFSNFARLKAERTVVLAERNRRQGR